jgi:hypothetical protein
MECDPWLNEEVVKEATPLVSAVVPSTVVPSRNCTLPVAVEGETLALKVTGDPTTAGFGIDIKVTDDEACTVCVRTAEVEGPLFASPAYFTVMEWVPGFKEAGLNVADPLVSVAEPIVLLPSRN